MIWSPDHLSKRQDCRHIFERFFMQKIYTLTWKQSPPGNSAGDLFGMLSSRDPFEGWNRDLQLGDQVGSRLESPGWLKQTCRLLVSFLAYERQKLRPGFFPRNMESFRPFHRDDWNLKTFLGVQSRKIWKRLNYVFNRNALWKGLRRGWTFELWCFCWMRYFFSVKL